MTVRKATRLQRLQRLATLERHQGRFQHIAPLKQWMATLSDDDVDTLAAAAERVKAGDPMRFDSPDLQRLEADFQAFMERC